MVGKDDGSSVATSTCPTRIRRKQGGGGVMLWADIVIVVELVSPFRVQEGAKLTNITVTASFLEFSPPMA